jgi:hypothetical protein
MLFNAFNDDILSRLKTANVHPPVIRKRHVVVLLFLDDLALGATTTVVLQRVINCI